jgi:hypothetical protein
MFAQISLLLYNVHRRADARELQLADFLLTKQAAAAAAPRWPAAGAPAAKAQPTTLARDLERFFLTGR